MSKINFVALNPVSDEELAQHREYSHGLGLPEVGSRPVTARLAVVGGGHSIADNIERIKNFDGEIWAINGTFQWCRENGIDATFYTIDPGEIVHTLCLGADRAVLADIVHPKVFQALSRARVELARIGIDAIQHWSTAASTAPMIASARGHRHVTFFGCESSFVGQTHTYKEDGSKRVWVECGGKEYTTTPQLITQVEFMAKLARGAPGFITVVGEGFLSALIEHGDYDVTHVSRDIHDSIMEKEAA